MDPTPEPPDVFAFLDYRAFLRSWFDWKKTVMPRYSHRAFVRRTGQRSPSLLVDTIEGRRNLTEATAIAFCKAMALERDESLFFRALVRFDQAGTHDEKTEAWAEISASKRFREARRIDGAMYDCLAFWYIAAIRELATIPGFRDDPAWIARRLQPRITASQARGALEALFTTGLLVRDEDGEILPGDPTFVTPVEVTGLAVHTYHQGMLELAKRSIEQVPPSQRHFTAITTAVPLAMLPRLKEEITRACNRLLETVSTRDEDPDEVVQVQLHFFPLTELPEEEP